MVSDETQRPSEEEVKEPKPDSNDIGVRKQSLMNEKSKAPNQLTPLNKKTKSNVRSKEPTRPTLANKTTNRLKKMSLMLSACLRRPTNSVIKVMFKQLLVWRSGSPLLYETL